MKLRLKKIDWFDAIGAGLGVWIISLLLNNEIERGVASCGNDVFWACIFFRFLFCHPLVWVLTLYGVAFIGILLEKQEK